MQDRLKSSTDKNLAKSGVVAASPASSGKAAINIDLDDMVSLTLTDQDVQRYRTTKTYSDNRAAIASFKDDDDSVTPSKRKTKIEKQRDVFAEKEGDYTTPVVILILLDIQDKLNEHLVELAKTNPQAVREYDDTVEIIKITLGIFAKSDTVMQGWMYAKMSYLGQLKARAEAKTKLTGKKVHIFEHLHQLVDLVERVKIPLVLVPLMRELSTWLFGMYWNDGALLKPVGKLNPDTDEPIKEMENGVEVFPFVSRKDRVIVYETYRFRFLDATYNHYRVSRIIDDKCAQCELANGIVVEEPKPAVKVEPVKTASAGDFSVKMCDSSLPGKTRIVVKINTAKFPGKSTAAKRALITMLKNPLGALLNYRVNAPIDQRMHEFADGLTRFVLSQEMRDMLKGSKATALTILKQYEEQKSAFFNSVLWAVSAGRLDNKNFALVAEARKKILATEKYELIIAAMCELRELAIKNQSTNIAVSVSEFLLNQMNIIRTSEVATGPGSTFDVPTTMTDHENKNIEILLFEVPDEHCEIVETICKVFHSIIANPIGFALYQSGLTDDDERINFLRTKVQDCGFTPVQEADYAEFFARTKDVVLKYINPAELSYLNLAHYFERGTLPRFIEAACEKTHAGNAAALLAMLDNPKVPLGDKILETIEIYQRVKDKDSTTLGPGLRHFLIGYIDWLTPCIPRENAVPNVAVSSKPRSGSGFK